MFFIWVLVKCGNCDNLVIIRNYKGMKVNQKERLKGVVGKYQKILDLY